MGQNLNKAEIKAIIASELDDMVDAYNVSIEDINVDIKEGKVQVTFGLSIVDEDNYIGLSFY